MVRALEQMKRAGTKTVDKHYTEGKATCTCFQASMFNTDHQITFCFDMNDTLFYDSIPHSISVGQNYIHEVIGDIPPTQW